jgi:hypothetical protein
MNGIFDWKASISMVLDETKETTHEGILNMLGLKYSLKE